MCNALGALAVVLASLGGPNPNPNPEPGMGPTGQDGAQITYSFKMVEIQGLEWRAARAQGLKPATSRGGVAVWTAPRDFFKSLPGGTVKELIAGPRITAFEQAAAHITTRHGQPYVTQASWRGDDLPPRETTEHVRTGMAATIRGRRLDQGVLAYLVIEDTDIHAIHTLTLPAPAAAPAPTPCTSTAVKAAACETPCEQDVVRTSFLPEPQPMCCSGEATESVATTTALSTTCTLTQAACEEKCNGTARPATAERSVQVQIPEVGHAEIAGEWVIPRDEILLVGFGPHTVADDDGKALVRERLAVISAEDLGSLPLYKAYRVDPPLPARPTATTASAAALPLPKLPSRELPQGINVDGTAAKLPPLPEEVEADEPSNGGSGPQPSPQTRRPRPQADEAPAETPAPRPAATREPKASKVSFNLGRSLFRPAGLPAVGMPNLQFMMPLKALELKLPLGQKLQLEVIGKVVPDVEPAPESEQN